MQEWFLIIVATVLVNNFVLVRFLGLCPFLGVSRQLDSATGMAIATTFVLTLASATSYLVDVLLLQPLNIEYLRTLAFILIIASLVQFTEILVRRVSPLLEQMLGIYLPLITTNCAVLGVALLNVQTSASLAESVLYGFGAAVGFGLVTIAFSAIRERLEEREIPSLLRGTAIALVTAGIMSLGFLGFSGLGQR